MPVLQTDAIQWHEGMLLLPQHFQQADLRLRELLHFHIKHLSPYHWGICHYKLDTVLLVNGRLHFSELEAILPDGLVVSIYESENEFLELDLSPFEKEIAEKPMMIHLVVPKFQYGKANAAGEGSRFKSGENIAVLDQNTGEGKVDVPKMVPNLYLYAGETPPSTLVGFPLMKVARDGNTYVTKPFIPPILKVEPQSDLSHLCGKICTKIREKIAFLSERIQSGGNTGFLSANVEEAVRNLSTGLLPFEAMLYSGVAHPYTLYVGLCSLAGHVQGLHAGQIPPVFAPFDQNDLKTTYNQVSTYITDMIDLIQEGYTTRPFEKKDRTFSLNLNVPEMKGRLVLGAKASPHMSMDELASWIETTIIASQSTVAQVRDDRILGAERTFIESDEEMKLIPAKGVLLFAVDTDERFVKPGETLHIFNASDSPEKRPEEIVLYVAKAW